MRKILLNNFRTHKLCLIFVSAIFVVVDVVVVVCIIYYYDSGITTNKQCTGIIIVIVDCIYIKYIIFFQKNVQHIRHFLSGAQRSAHKTGCFLAGLFARRIHNDVIFLWMIAIFYYCINIKI